jgi:hypothetical protein
MESGDYLTYVEQRGEIRWCLWHDEPWADCPCPGPHDGPVTQVFMLDHNTHEWWLGSEGEPLWSDRLAKLMENMGVQEHVRGPQIVRVTIERVPLGEVGPDGRQLLEALANLKTDPGAM